MTVSGFTLGWKLRLKEGLGLGLRVKVGVRVKG